MAAIDGIHFLRGDSGNALRIGITGPPGVGKNHGVLIPLAKDLKERGYNVVKLALTHVACGNIGGQSLHTFVLRHCLYGSFQKGVIILDEISLVPLPIIAALVGMAIRQRGVSAELAATRHTTARRPRLGPAPG